MAWHQRCDAWAVAAAGFTPLPCKLFTITAGVCKVSFLTFMLASIASRAARFFPAAGLICTFGAPVQYFIGGFVLIKLVL